MADRNEIGTKLLACMMFIPGTSADRLDTLGDAVVPALILDLEDTVAPERHDEARAEVVRALAGRVISGDTHVRVNRVGTVAGWLDLLAAVRPGLAGIVLPKVESAWEIKAADWVIGSLEAERSLQPGAIELMGTIETSRGVRAVGSIARASSRLRRLCFGSGDFSADLGLPTSHMQGTRVAAVEAAMQNVVFASAAAGLQPPHDGVYPLLTDDDGLAREVERSVSMGFWGKHTLTSRQTAVVLATLSRVLPRREVAEHRLQRYDAALRLGEGVSELDGWFVNNTDAERVRATLRMWESLGEARVDG